MDFSSQRWPRPVKQGVMADLLSHTVPAVKEFIMRYYPAAIALSLALAVQASVSMAQGQEADPRAASLVAEGQAALANGDEQAAIDAFEAALTRDPGYVAAFVALGDAARSEGLEGKAIHYYRLALDRDPRNYAALAGEGAALVQKGALDKAKLSLNELESLCGANCPETRGLAAAIAAGPVERVRTAEAVTPDTSVTQN